MIEKNSIDDLFVFLNQDILLQKSKGFYEVVLSYER